MAAGDSSNGSLTALFQVAAGDSCASIGEAKHTSNITEGGVPCPDALAVNDTLLLCPEAPGPPTPVPPPTPPLPPPPAAGCVNYTVAPADNCHRVAGKHDTTVPYVYEDRCGVRESG